MTDPQAGSPAPATAWHHHGNIMATAWQLHGNIMVTAWQLRVSCMATARRQPGNSMATAWHLHGNSMARAWQHHGNIMATARRRLGNCMATARELHGNCMATAGARHPQTLTTWPFGKQAGEGEGGGRVPGGGTRGATASPSMAPWLSRAEREARGQAERETTPLRSKGGLAVSRRRPPRRRRPGLSAGAAGYPVGSPRVPRRSDGGRAIRFWTRGERAVVPRRPNGDRSDAGRVIRSSPS